METELFIYRRVRNMKGNGLKIRCMEKVFLLFAMVNNMKENSRKINMTGKENILGRLETHM
jgi:hypothetical protein